MSENFRFSAIHGLLRDLAILIRTSHKNREAIVQAAPGYARHQIMSHPNIVAGMDDCVETARSLANFAQTFLGHLECSHIDNACRSLSRWADSPPHSWGELNNRTRALRDAIEVEMRDYLFYQYPKQKGVMFRNFERDWLTARNAFPEIAYDAYCATDCYALGHNVASVFHSMRIAEIGLRALAKDRKITLPRNKNVEWASWQEIISALDSESKSIGRSNPAGPEKDKALAFYSGAVADLNGFKDEYRNLVMHVRANYDELQALRALTNVHAFMNRVADSLKPMQTTVTMPTF